jgi:hypothetical protein
LTQDTYVLPGSAGNYGVQQYIAVGSANNYQSLVQFDLTTLPAGTIAKATLVLFAKTVTTAGTVNISTANGAWTEAGVTGNNAPGAGTTVASGVAVSTTSSYIYVDATAAAQGWVTTPSSNNGFLITPVTGVNVQFDSKESTSTSHPAELYYADRRRCDRCNRTPGGGGRNRSWNDRCRRGDGTDRRDWRRHSRSDGSCRRYRADRCRCHRSDGSGRDNGTCRSDWRRSDRIHWRGGTGRGNWSGRGNGSGRRTRCDGF